MNTTSRLNKQSIVQSFEDGLFPGGVHLFDTVESTNDWSLAQIRTGRELPFVCIADRQTRGRGRRGRHWLSPPGANIYVSLAWSFGLAPDQLGLLSLAQGVAVIDALNQVGIVDAWLKWPNDVLIRSDKIAGVLIETVGVGDAVCSTVIGVGLNFLMPENVAAGSGVHWTDVAHAISGPMPDRNAMVSTLLTEMVKMCSQYQQKALALYDELKPGLDALTGRDVSVHLESGDRMTGTVLGISPVGELRVLVDGRERRFNSADVSLTGNDNGPLAGAGHADG